MNTSGFCSRLNKNYILEHSLLPFSRNKKQLETETSVTAKIVNLNTQNINGSCLSLQVWDSPPSQRFIIKLIQGMNYTTIKMPETENPLFVKITHLSRELGITSSLIKAENKTTHDLTHILNGYQLLIAKTDKQHLQTIIKTTNKIGLSYFKALVHLQKRINENIEKSQKHTEEQNSELIHSVSEILDDRRFEKKKMMLTLKKIGKQLEEIQSQKEGKYTATIKLKDAKQAKSYGFLIDCKGHIYIEGKLLGRGAFKRVEEAIRLDKHKTEALTIFIRDSQNQIEKEERWINCLHNRHVDHIVPCYKLQGIKTYTPHGTGAIVSLQEKMTDGETLKHDVTPSQALPVLRDVADALAGMHKEKIIHNDIKPSNILFKENARRTQSLESCMQRTKSLEGYVHDFGHTTRKGCNSDIGTLEYLAPESFADFQAWQRREKRFSELETSSFEQDSFAFGVSILEIITKELPYVDSSKKCFGEIQNQEQMTLALSLFEKHMIDSNQNISQKEQIIQKEIVQVAEKLLRFDPKERISCAEAKELLDNILNQSCL